MSDEAGRQRPRIRKAVIPAAGLGTRFLPATKSMPKEMLPIIDKPVLQFVVEEAVASGIEDILIITGRGKRAIENHFDFHPQLEAMLRATGREELIDQVRDVGDRCRIFYIRQRRQLGLGDAVALGREHVGDEPFALLLGDTIIDPQTGSPPGLRQLMDAYEQQPATVVAVHAVPDDWVSRYGIIEPARESTPMQNLSRVARLVEKPEPGEAPSNLAIAGRYILAPQIFECLDRIHVSVGGELQLTDAINLLASEQAVYALAWNAKRYDIGNRIEYAKCFIDHALRRPDTADAVRAHIQQALASSGDSPA
ncbi:MAG: UTP--glucose-1-phosphate uridylyltransferase GalU [Phycisphaerales bacterium]|nr:UTP--glucose-1-phosphate uridylyltransferase GalU [Phycisphaerales bacterium]